MELMGAQGPRPSRQVKYNILTMDGRWKATGFGDVALAQTCSQGFQGFDYRPLSYKAGYLAAFLDQRADQVRADESASAGYEGFAHDHADRLTNAPEFR
jgi:hypothetical protein